LRKAGRYFLRVFLRVCTASVAIGREKQGFLAFVQVLSIRRFHRENPAACCDDLGFRARRDKSFTSAD
jgi:hypothetical protein